MPAAEQDKRCTVNHHTAFKASSAFWCELFFPDAEKIICVVRHNRSSKISFLQNTANYNVPPLQGHSSPVTDSSCVLYLNQTYVPMDLDSMDTAVQLVVLVKEEAFEELNAGVDQQDPEHFHIKEEQEELLTSLEEEQLNLKETDDARFSFTSVSIKSEDDEEKPMFSQLHQQQIEDKHIPTSSSADQIKAETSERVETRRTPDLNPHEQTDSSDTEVSGDEENDDEDSEPSDSGPETGERDDDWNESRSSKTDVKTVNKSFSCPQCGKHFLHKWSLQKHVRVTNHSAIRSSGCLINNKLVKVTQRVDSGRKGRIKLKSYICDDCGKVFKDKSTLIAHIRVHTGQKPFACELCEQRFRQKSTLTIHMRVHTGQKPFACELCEQRFSHKTSLNNHMRIHTGEKPYACKICGQKFAQKTSFNGHMTVHTGHKPFACELCGQSFSQKATLSRHMIVHSGEKPFACELCGQQFSRKASLKNHMSVHTGQKPFACERCGRRFRRKTHLISHMRLHTGQKPFACNFCGQRFRQHTGLTCHMTVHTGQKPFACELCGQRFARNTHLNNHMRVHIRNKELI